MHHVGQRLAAAGLGLGITLGLAGCASAPEPASRNGAAGAAPVFAGAVPLPPGHPLLGVWSLDIPGTSCREITTVRANGTLLMVSGNAKAVAEVEIDPTPSASGFYKRVERFINVNGKPDCRGHGAMPGEVVTTYISMPPSGSLLLVCQAPDLRNCIGPFRRTSTSLAQAAQANEAAAVASRTRLAATAD